jgi:glutathionyl-hydroquinone reductase
MVVRELKGLQEIIPHTVVHYHMGDKGWRFGTSSEDELEGCQPDPLYDLKFLRELYFKAQPDYEGRFTVPVLWDKKTETIVNNESRSRPRIGSLVFAFVLRVLVVCVSGCFALLHVASRCFTLLERG